jgi:hypothetical protein
MRKKSDVFFKGQRNNIAPIPWHERWPVPLPEPKPFAPPEHIDKGVCTAHVSSFLRTLSRNKEICSANV